ncbi:putative UDP-glucuronate decarboxylase [Helianthus annuus]|nr:putative UDP-glucuronate decarboxylase [Helianthus annuus]
MARVDLDVNVIKPVTICMISVEGFISSYLCEKLMSETPHAGLAIDVYNDKIKHLLEPDSIPWNGRIQFHRCKIKNDSRLEGLIKCSDLVICLLFVLDLLFCSEYIAV